MGGQSVAERAEAIFRSDLTREEVDNLLRDKAMGVRIAAAIRGVELGHLQSKDAAASLKKEKNGAARILRRWQQTREECLLDVMIIGKFHDELHSAANDPDAPDDLFWRLFELKIPSVSWQVAQRDGLTAEQLDVLAATPSYTYSVWESEATENLPLGAFYADGFVSCHPQVIAALHPLTKPETLLKLRKARSRYVRAALAHRPDPDSLPTLAADKDNYVRRAVAMQEVTPPDLLRQLSLDDDPYVRTAVHENPAAPEDVRAQAALLGVNPRNVPKD